MNQGMAKTPDPARPVSDSHLVDIQWAVAAEDDLPGDDKLSSWVCAALDHIGMDAAAVSVRLMADDEMIALNRRYRDKDAPTNVLSFPAGCEDEAGRRLLGDIAVCLDVIRREAPAQGKTVADHLAHMLVHGVLHLSGYDHLEDHQALEMESTEVEILRGFGIDDPYGDRSSQEGSDNE